VAYPLLEQAKLDKARGKLRATRSAPRLGSSLIVMNQDRLGR
jgi:hypothetical protein